MGCIAIAAWLFDITALKDLIISSLFTKFYFPLCHIVVGSILLYTQIGMNRVRSRDFKKSEEKYQSLIEQASDAIYILDFQGNFTDVNASMCKMTGYTKEELLHLSIESIIDPEELKVDPLPKKMDKTDGSVIRERRFVSKTKTIFTVEVNVKRFSDDSIMVIARDITGRKKMESELREAELKFRTVTEKSMVGIYIVQNEKFSYVNPRFAEVFGYSPEEMTGTFKVDSILHHDYKAIANDNVRKRITGEVESVNYEAMGTKKDGTVNWVEFHGSRAIIDGEPTIIGSMIDVTERKKAEEELRSSEQQYKLLFDSNPMPMWMIAKDDQTIIAVNDAGAKHYGYEKAELLHKSTKIFRAKDDYDEQMEGYRQEAQNTDGSRIVKHFKKNGTAMYVQIIAYDITFEGRPVRLSMTNDITEKLNAEQNLKNAYESIQNHINSIKEMAWKQSHLIRSPLANLQALIAMLKEDPKDGELFTHMQNELKRMDTIIIEMAKEAADHD
ncbi:PAS domain-containing protein [Mucilaginibacter sp. BJC16-A38]|uniref:PAS domain-containing protein n=1 Tax=Mucilaginibacter phenanthrenivorans TaxID=1234842 RepID=UPI002158966D|nr:PAS domain-containing protein [Mucilaginibacter phenanthrenivorans]MCR8559757.1 PAS domain-containing protein [Mucilaginibacter phenanthrenivorans]